MQEHLPAIAICKVYQVSVLAVTAHEFQTAFINPGFDRAKTDVNSSNSFSPVISAVTNMVTWMHLMGTNKDRLSKYSAEGSLYILTETGWVLII